MDTHQPPHVPVLPSPRFFFAVAIGATVFFAIWTWIVRPWEAPPAFDVSCADHWRDWSAAHPGALKLMIFLTDLGGIAAHLLLVVMGVIWQSAIKNKTLVIAWLVIVIGGAVSNQGIKVAIGRPRPPNPESVVHETNNSFPSGHSMGSAVGYGLLGYALILPQRHPSRRIAAVSFMIVIVLAIGFSRMYLRAHWFSDVVGGISLGVAWLFLCLGWLERRRQQTG